MKKIKPSLMLISIFLIGIVLGFLVSGQLTKQKMDEFMRWGSEEGFKEVILEKINPEENQMSDLEPILNKYAKINDELHKTWQKEHGELMRSLTVDLESVLSPGQMAEWKKHGSGHNNN